MPINASPHFERAQLEYEKAETTEQKIRCLKKMIALSPKHKGAENLNAQLKRRLAKLKYVKEKENKAGKSSFKGIKKEGHQIVILGKTNTGKSTLLKLMTNAEPKISPIQFTTTKPIIGMKTIETVSMQLIENPSINSEYYDKGLTNSADALIILITSLQDIKEIKLLLEKATDKQIILYNDKQNLTKDKLRKLEAKMKSKRYNFLIINLTNPSQESIKELENKIFQTFDKIRIYTKEPNKDKSPKPIILKPDSTIKDVAEKILKGFSQKIKQTKIWGPSSKFPGQVVGLNHKLKDLDVVEFKTK